MSVKVIDLNEEVGKASLNSNNVEVEAKETPPIEEAPEEVEKTAIANEVVEETAKGSLNTKGVETNEEPKPKQEQTEEPKPKPKPKPKPSDLVFCPDCSRQMTYKNLQYSHKCSPEPPPVKKQANPKSKAKPNAKPAKPPPEVYYSESEEEEMLQPAIKKKVKQPQPVNPTPSLVQQYQLLQQQMMQQKQERYNKICQGMFAPRTKKR